MPQKATFTEVGKTSDGVACYWGKKNSGEPDSENLTLWITVGKPKKDASNYFRVPEPDEEKRHKENLYDEPWQAHMAARISEFDAATIKKTWKGTKETR